MRGTPDTGAAGAGVRVEHRFSRGMAGFAEGTVGHHWGVGAGGLRFDALAGFEMVW